MERLTYRDADGTAMMKKRGGWQGEGIARLAAYEDTGLEPEEVNRCKLTLMGKSLAEITEFDGVAINRLKELATADKQGRLVALPCKVGDTVYVLPIGLGLEGDFITEAEVLSVSSGDAMFRVKYKSGQLDRYTWSSIGKTVFLTREEAERALAKQ